MTPDRELRRLLAQAPHSPSRRRFLGRAGLALGGLALGPALLAACADDDGGGTGGTGGTGDGGACGPSGAEQRGDGRLTFANWPLYIDEETVDLFVQETGIDLTYTDEVTDNNTYFARIQPVLNSGDVLDADAFVVTYWLTSRLIELCWVEPLPLDQIPNAANLTPTLRNPLWDPTGQYTLPWQSGITGICYNIDAAGRELRSMEDLLDPEFKGRIGMLLEMRDTLGLWMLHTGKSIDNPTFDDAAEALEIIERAAGDGTIRQFTENDYQDDLINGDFVACLGWSGDISQLQLENPALRFAIPESGGIFWTDSMVVPRRCPHLAEVAAWMDYVYDPEVAARIAAWVGYISPVDGAREALAASSDPELAALADNELMFPSDETLEALEFFGPLSEEDEARLDEAFARITGV